MYDILSGHILELIKEESEKMKICRNCELYSNLTKENIKDEHPIYLKSLVHISNQEVCDSTKEFNGVKGCGCRLKAKLSNPNPTCPAKKF